jgi:hypothetical protein
LLAHQALVTYPHGPSSHDARARAEVKDDASSDAIEGADRLGHLPIWQAHAALGRALYGVGKDDGAAAEVREAAEIIQGFASTLTLDKADPLLASSPIQEILRAR